MASREGLTDHGPNSVWYHSRILFPGMCGPQNPMSSSSCMLEHWFCIAESLLRGRDEEQRGEEEDGCEKRLWMDFLDDPRYQNTVLISHWMDKYQEAKTSRVLKQSTFFCFLKMEFRSLKTLFLSSPAL